MTGEHGALARTLRRMRRDGGASRCELCARVTGEIHPHVLDTRSGGVLCACRTCAPLFSTGSGEREHYLRVPDRRTRLPGLPPDELGVPVGLAFFVAEPDGTAVAHYPSPLGATRWEIGRAVWRRLTAGGPPPRPLVEAVLVNTVREARERWLVPIDDCYRLVALVRREWRGMSGGDQVWAKIRQFFTDLAVSAGH